jgi:tRNA pseudouridine55 synthase
MKGILNRPDHFFIAIIAALSVYVFLFMYFQISSYKELVYIEPFENYSRIEDPEEIQIKKDQIEVPPSNLDGELTNVVRDNNDTRKKSNQNWSQDKASGNPEQTAKDFEKQLFKEAGGEKERERIKNEAEEQKKKLAAAVPDKTTSSSQSSKANQFAGNVMVDFSLKGRTAFENNNWYVRNPGYTCGHGSEGTVVVLISVDNAGKVISTSIDEARCENATSCMRDQALKYAGISKFNSGSSKQDGYIRYRFVSQ